MKMCYTKKRKCAILKSKNMLYEKAVEGKGEKR